MPARPSPPVTAPAWHILRSLRRSRFIAVGLGAGMLAEIALTAVVPYSFQYLVNQAIGHHDARALTVTLIVLAASVALLAVIGVARDYLAARTLSAVLSDLRVRMFHHLQQLSGEYYARTHTAEIMSHFSSDLGSLENALSAAIPQAILPMLQAALNVVLLAFLSLPLTLVACLVFPFALVGPRFVAPKTTLASQERSDAESRNLVHVQESAVSHAVIKAFGLERHLLQRFQRSTEDLHSSSVRVGFLTALLERTASLGVLGVQVLVMGVGVLLVYRGSLSLGALVAFQGLFVQFSTSLVSTAQYLPGLVQAQVSLRGIDALLAEEPMVAVRPGAADLPRLGSEIAFQGVSFGYRPGTLTLTDVTCSVPAGSSVAFVGGNGSGKSTIVSLLARFYDVTAGAVLIDGVDIREVTPDSLRAQLGVVFQTSLLFDASVMENIRMGRPEASDEECIAAARAADVDEFIDALSEGYDTRLWEGGEFLSGGQRQRIAIARALVRHPAVLVLDETTSALDPMTEAAVQETLRRVGKDRTVIALSPRLAQVADSDHIFVLRKGALVEEGTHQELLRLDGVYARLWEKQSGFAIGGDWARVEPERLKRIPILSVLHASALEEVASRFVTERHAAGGLIFRQGDAGDRMFIVVRGAVEVTVDQPGGGARRVAVLEDGDEFGELALLQDAPRNASVRARQDSIFLSLRREDLVSLLEESPELKQAMWEVAKERLEEDAAALTVVSPRRAHDNLVAGRPPI